MKNFVSLLFTALIINGCGAPATVKNTYVGTPENYACTLPDGQIQLTLSEAVLPQCIKLSDLPPEEAEAITKTSTSQTTVETPGTIKIDATRF